MKIGRNDPCPCGSGKKYKRCCLEKQVTEYAEPKAAKAPIGLLSLMRSRKIFQKDPKLMDEFNMRNALVERKTALNKINMPVSYLTEEDIRQLTQGCKRERDQLLIILLFQTGVRISEALALTPAAIRNFEGKAGILRLQDQN